MRLIMMLRYRPACRAGLLKGLARARGKRCGGDLAPKFVARCRFYKKRTLAEAFH